MEGPEHFLHLVQAAVQVGARLLGEVPEVARQEGWYSVSDAEPLAIAMNRASSRSPPAKG